MQIGLYVDFKVCEDIYFCKRTTARLRELDDDPSIFEVSMRGATSGAFRSDEA